MIVKVLTIAVLVWLVASNWLDATNSAEVLIYKHTPLPFYHRLYTKVVTMSTQKYYNLINYLAVLLRIL